MSAFSQGFKHGFFHGMFGGNPFCCFNSFNMFNFGCWNSMPLFFTPNYNFMSGFRYHSPMLNMPSLWSFSVPNFRTPQFGWNSMNFSSYNSTYTPDFSLGDTFRKSTTSIGEKEVKEVKEVEEVKSTSNDKTKKNFISKESAYCKVESARYHSEISNSDNNKYNDIILKYSKEYDVDPNLIKAIIRQESVFNPNAGSGAGAKGLMQLMPATAKDLGLTVNENRDDRLDPEQNIKGGVKYFKTLLNRYDGNVEKALAAYNWGMGNVDKKGLDNLPKETREYIPKVLGYYENYKSA